MDPVGINKWYTMNNIQIVNVIQNISNIDIETHTFISKNTLNVPQGIFSQMSVLQF